MGKVWLLFLPAKTGFWNMYLRVLDGSLSSHRGGEGNERGEESRGDAVLSKASVVVYGQSEIMCSSQISDIIHEEVVSFRVCHVKAAKSTLK